MNKIIQAIAADQNVSAEFRAALPVGPCADQMKCQHMKCAYEGWDGERYRCDKCGASYFLDYDEMR